MLWMHGHADAAAHPLRFQQRYHVFVVVHDGPVDWRVSAEHRVKQYHLLQQMRAHLLSRGFTLAPKRSNSFTMGMWFMPAATCKAVESSLWRLREMLWRLLWRQDQDEGGICRRMEMVQIENAMHTLLSR